MPKFSIEKSITIDAPAGDAFSTVRNFRDWPKWSPWLIAEPACTLAYAENGDRYSWDGEIIGAGEMEITAEDALHSDLQRLRSYLDQHGATPVGEPFSIYHKWALGKGLCDYTLGFPVTTAPDDLPADFVSGNLPDCSVYSVEHTGPYRHLGNAWSAGVMHARAKVFRQDKSSPPFEIYRSDPATTPDTELVTSVHFPLK